jgi:hypothetical protein
MADWTMQSETPRATEDRRTKVPMFARMFEFMGFLCNQKGLIGPLKASFCL